MAHIIKTRTIKRSPVLGFRTRVEFTLPRKFRKKIAPGAYFRADQIGSEVVLRAVDATIDDMIEEARRDYEVGNFKTYKEAKNLVAALRR